MNTVEPIREIQKILAIKRILKEQSNPRDYLLFTMGINDLLSLKVQDVLDKKGEIVDYLHLREQKTKKEKKIKINKAVKEALATILRKLMLLIRIIIYLLPIDLIKNWIVLGYGR